MPRVSRRGRATRAAKPPPPPTATREAPVQFAHESEVEFARILDFYGITWIYEPRSFPLRWDG
jgi:hypoxanthine phosphoribosyltransferase